MMSPFVHVYTKGTEMQMLCVQGVPDDSSWHLAEMGTTERYVA